jgi:hypothetical protein
MMFVPHRKHAYGPPRPVTEISLLYYKQMMFIPHREHIWNSTVCYGIALTFCSMTQKENLAEIPLPSAHILFGLFVSPEVESDKFLPVPGTSPGCS